MELKPIESTLTLMDAKKVAEQDNGWREHLGASEIGDPCSRKLWYLFRWVAVKKFDARMLRLFARGQ